MNLATGERQIRQPKGGSKVKIEQDAGGHVDDNDNDDDEDEDEDEDQRGVSGLLERCSAVISAWV